MNVYEALVKKAEGLPRKRSGYIVEWETAEFPLFELAPGVTAEADVLYRNGNAHNASIHIEVDFETEALEGHDCSTNGTRLSQYYSNDTPDGKFTFDSKFINHYLPIAEQHFASEKVSFYEVVLSLVEGHSPVRWDETCDLGSVNLPGVDLGGGLTAYAQMVYDLTEPDDPPHARIYLLLETYNQTRRELYQQNYTVDVPHGTRPLNSRFAEYWLPIAERKCAVAPTLEDTADV